MSLWLDMLGTQVRYVPTKTFGSTRIAEADMHSLHRGFKFSDKPECFTKNTITCWLLRLLTT